MNPYNLLKRLGLWRALDATLISEDGSTYAFTVKPEEVDDRAIVSQYDSIVRYRAWSTSDAGVDPKEGDVLRVAYSDGTTADYEIARNPETTNYIEWKFLNNATRRVFYTRY